MPKKSKPLSKPSASPSLFLLFLGSFLITLFFALFTLPFEPPDENAHFSSLQFLANEGRMPTLKDINNLTLEELKVEEYFGVVEHQNKYSYHPEYRPQYTEGNIGLYEPAIAELNTPENRQTYSTFQAATYPPLYYLLSLPAYRLAQQSSFLPRLFISRLPAVLLTSASLVLTYHIGLIIFASPALAATLAALQLFFPMTTYLGAGINSDHLHNFLFAFGIYFLLKLLKDGPSRSNLLWFGTILGLDLLTKPQAYILIPIFFLALTFHWRWDGIRKLLMTLLLAFIPALILAGWQEIPKFVVGSASLGSTAYSATNILYGGGANFNSFLTNYVRTHLSEMPVWYWGVFKWFGVLLPRPWWWLGIRLFLISGIGLILFVYRSLRARIFSPQLRIILFIFGSNALYALALFWFDWQFYQQFGRSLGLQPRYYFPLLSPQLALILWGVRELGWTNRLKYFITLALLAFFLSLHMIGLYTQLRAYYDLTPLTLFISELSQYKPVIAKGNWWYLWFSTYFLGIITSLIFILRQITRYETRDHRPRLQ